MNLAKTVAPAALALALFAGRTAFATCNQGIAYQTGGGCVAGFPKVLSGVGGTSQLRGHPVIADLGLLAGHKQIVFATQSGKLWVVNDDGSVPAGIPITLPGNAAVLGGPAVGDVDGDGKADVVVAWGTDGMGGVNSPGGFGAFKNPGAGNTWSSTPLWTRVTKDLVGPGGTGPDFVSDGAVSTPAIGDVDNDGHNEVVVATLDQYVYVVNGATGADKPGWPFWTGDTIFSSPALADLDGDGKLEIIIGADAHNQPFTPGLPFTPTTNGGLLFVLNYAGGIVPGFPVQIDQVIWSAPVVGDIDGDGRPEIVFGTGSYFGVPVTSHLVYALHCDGTTVAGWPVRVDGQVMTAPALGDLDNDGLPDVVVTDDRTGPSGTNHVYAFKGNGTLLWKRQPIGYFSETLNAGDPVIADVLPGGPGSGKEVLVPENAEIIVYDAGGTQLTGIGPVGFHFYAASTVNDVAVDVSGSTVEIVTTSDIGGTLTISAWKGTGSTTQVPWGMFHRDAAANGLAPNAGICAPRAPVSTALHPLTPCRVLDTRNTQGPLGGPALQPHASRSFNIFSVCGVPADAVAVSANLTVTNVTAPGELVIYPSDVARPLASSISFTPFKTRANNGLVYLTATTDMFSVYNNSAGSLDFIVDVNGYFQ